MDIDIRSDNGDVVGDNREWRARLRLVLDEDGEAMMYVEDKHSSDNGVPMAVWNGRTRVWTGDYYCTGVVSLKALQELAIKVSPLLDRVCAGHELMWDGNNTVGRLDEDASEASDEIEKLVGDCQWADESQSVWDATDWIADAWESIAGDLQLAPDATDKQKTEAVVALNGLARSENCALLHTDKAIDWLVEKLQESAD